MLLLALSSYRGWLARLAAPDSVAADAVAGSDAEPQNVEVLTLPDDVTMESLLARVAALEEQVGALLARVSEPLTVALRAPVRVVDASGNCIVQLACDLDGGCVQVLDAAGNRAATLGVTPGGGMLDLVTTPEARLVVALEARDTGGWVEVTDGAGNTLFQTGRQAPGSG